VNRQAPVKSGERSSLYARMSTISTAAGSASALRPPLVRTALEDGEVVGFKRDEGRIQHFPPGHDNDVDAGGQLVAPEELSGQPLRPVPLDGRPQLFRGRHAETGSARPVGGHEQRHVAAVGPRARVVGALELGTATNPLGGRQTGPGQGFYRSSATVRRLRPLARRRFRTILPFLVAIRTRNPCVFFRRRLFGWNVRLPFMISYTKKGQDHARTNFQY
jgi:hypothetical protein